MSYGRAMALLAVIVGLTSCKLGVRSSTPKTEVEDASGNLLAYAAVTTLSFRDKQQVPVWEFDARARCGDKPTPSPSHLDDLDYELIPESTRQKTGAINRGDSSLCRYQPHTPDSMQLTRNLFADKALAIKVKYLRGYENQPPPMIRFNSGGAVHVSQDRFASLFIGQCSEFAIMNGIQFCKTTDSNPKDGRVIWVALVAPMASPAVYHGGGKGAVGKGVVGKGEVVVVEQQQAGKVVEQIDHIKGVEQVDYGKGGKGHVMPVTPGGGRIDMHITLPWLQSGFNLAVEVPNFNAELIGYMQGGTGHPPHPYIGPPVTVDYGDKLDRDQIAILVPRPLLDPRGSSGEAKMLRLTLKTKQTKPHDGKWVGFVKVAGGIAGGIAAVGVAVAFAAPTAIAAIAATAVTGGLSIGAGVTGIMDLNKWWKSINDRGAYDDFMVPSDKKNCPAIYGTNLTFDKDDLYLTFKSERRQGFVVDWWDNLGHIQHVPIGHIGVNAWNKATLEGFTVYYCRKSFQKHCDKLSDKMFSEDLKDGLKNCANTDDSVIAEFGQH